VLLYDLTSTYFEIDAAALPEGDKRRHGYSRDRRSDCPQVVIALVVQMLSCDLTQRGWLGRDTYLPAVKIGEVVRSLGGGCVIGSRHPGFSEGDLVAGLVGRTLP
jgi:NADPH-dependent curcumin reductase CurA